MTGRMSLSAGGLSWEVGYRAPGSRNLCTWQPRHGKAYIPQPEPGGLNQRPLSAIRVAAS